MTSSPSPDPTGTSPAGTGTTETGTAATGTTGTETAARGATGTETAARGATGTGAGATGTGTGATGAGAATATPRAGADAPGGAARQPARHATLRYTLMRIGLFAASFLVLSVLAWFGIIPEGIGKSNPLWLLALAILVSAPLSLVLLRTQREAMAQQIGPRMDRVSGSVKSRIAAQRDHEDGV